MRVVISKFERDLLLTHPETEIIARDLLPVLDRALNGSPEQCNTLREACADLLLRIGFDEEDEPTIEGRALEDLIDKLME